MFVLNSKIIITNPNPVPGKPKGYKFSGVHDIRIKKSIYGLLQSAWIKVPSLTPKGVVSELIEVGWEIEI